MEISVAVINYNMPERTDALVEFVRSHTRRDFELVVVDNGSDLVSPSKYTTVWIPKNKDTHGGWSSALAYSTCDAVWFLSTSTAFIDTDLDIIEEMTKHLKGDTVAVCTNWRGASAVTHLQHSTERDESHEINYVGPMALWNKKWLKKHLPDKRLTTSWGTDFELSYSVKQDKKKVWICHNVMMKVNEGIMYEWRRGHVTLDERRAYARKQMYDILSEKYGENWKEILTEGTGIDPAKI